MNRTLNPMLALAKQLVTLTGSFATNGTGAPASVKGVGVTPTRTGVGKYKLTLKDPVVDVVSAHATIGMGAATAVYVQMSGAPTLNASGLYEVSLQVVNGSGTATEVASAAGNAINWTITARQSSAGPTS